jgi:glycosyltransferase involved in cell wall biosynthesis
MNGPPRLTVVPAKRDICPITPMLPSKQVAPESARIIEIGASAVMKSAFPDRTRLLWTYPKLMEPTRFYEPFSLPAAWQVLKEIRAGRVDLIVVWVAPYAPWNFRQLKALYSRPFRPWRSLVRIFGIQMLRFLSTDTPILAIDNEDSRTIAAHNLFLLDKAKHFFKRELPVDHWQVFQSTAHAGLPGWRFRSNAKNIRRVQKLRPISIGVAPPEPVPKEVVFPEKTVDLFIALTLEGGTTVRRYGMKFIRALASRGVVLDIAEKRIEYSEYMRRMERAWLTWSPEGLGWDCFRHYEAPLVCTVPVINSPTITRYEPLREGVHAIYYQPDDPTSLGDVVVSALADKDRLRQMAQEARSHVLRFHLRPRPLADSLLHIGLGLEEPR